jgi:hypothetical protein
LAITGRNLFGNLRQILKNNHKGKPHVAIQTHGNHTTLKDYISLRAAGTSFFVR